MATSAERMRALRDRQRRGFQRLTIDVSEDDLRQIAQAGYEGAAGTDHDQQAHAVALFLTDAVAQLDLLRVAPVTASRCVTLSHDGVTVPGRSLAPSAGDADVDCCGVHGRGCKIQGPLLTGRH
jgi:hypothetical protein